MKMGSNITIFLNSFITFYVFIFYVFILKGGGSSLTEVANIMVGFGVDKAMDLDSGGSSVMFINEVQIGCPSDTKGERAVGDALLFLPS